MTKPSPSERLKLFGMSNLMLEQQLDGVERSHALDLGRSKRKDTPQIDNTYYPQFDEVIREEAKRMSRYYETFYCLEKLMRKLVSEKLKSTQTADWWNQTAPREIVPQVVRDEVRKRVGTERDSGVTIRSLDPLDYTTFGELGVIIIANWQEFSDLFNSRKAVERVMANLNTLRGPIAHCCPLATDEIARLELSVKDLFRLME